ncbi:MAG: hydroxyacylglutathione hydrolase [Alphaproteobacteria bacterium]|nr:hydroxyacylglutathione hydrolase [Alphaproteobacteria bacterium]
MSALEIHQIPVLSDNYVYLLRDVASGDTAVVDPSLSAPVLKAAADLGLRLTHVLNTHHHWDHTGGNLDIKDATGCKVVGALADADRIPGLDIALDDGEVFTLGASEAKVIMVPGHTSGHVAYWFQDASALFSGDTLFSLGCGRLFEGSAAQMWRSLRTLRELPDQTQVYCGHEYTLANAKFAISVDPDNEVLRTRLAEVEALRARRQPTVPSLMATERAANPFLRADDPALKARLGMGSADAARVFGEIRRRKDAF